MAHPFHHAESSARRFGGGAEDYQAIHDWFDASKEHFAHPMHRALRHHTQGIFEAQRVFGATITNSAGRTIPVRWVGEQHVKEDCRCIPTLADWMSRIEPSAWMVNGVLLNGSPAIETDPFQDWQRAVAAQQTILGFEDWMNERISTERHAA